MFFTSEIKGIQAIAGQRKPARSEPMPATTTPPASSGTEQPDRHICWMARGLSGVPRMLRSTK
jgi:hypothetical protein